MNDAQRLLVVIALVVIGFVLAWLMLTWGDGQSTLISQTHILIFHEARNPKYPNLQYPLGFYRYGIYTAPGVPYMLAVLFGMVLPLCLFAAAAFLAFGRRISK